VDNVPSLNTAAKTNVKKFVDMMKALKGLPDESVAVIMREVYKQTGLKEALAHEKTEDPATNVEELINSASQYDSETEDPGLNDYLQQIALISDSDAYDAEAGAVSLMTLHAAKGLEFPAVRIIGVEDGLIPHTRSIDDSDSLEEERRLLFVGITRAEQTITLSYANNRTVKGASMATIRSGFLRKLTALEHRSEVALKQWDDDQEDSGDLAGSSSDSDYYGEESEAVQFRVGQLVRHPSLGIGRINKIIPAGENSRVEMQLQNGSRKTLYLKYARLENLDYMD